MNAKKYIRCCEPTQRFTVGKLYGVQREQRVFWEVISDAGLPFLIYKDSTAFEEVSSRYHHQNTDSAKPDMVNSPNHYALFDDIEAIDVIARSMTVEMFRGYCLGNMLKYRLRVGKKDSVEQELAKANKYKEIFEQHKGKCYDAS